jgi:hypothetical protein
MQANGRQALLDLEKKEGLLKEKEKELSLELLKVQNDLRQLKLQKADIRRKNAVAELFIPSI